MRASLMLLICAGVLGCGDTTTTPDMAVTTQDLSMAPTTGDMAKGAIVDMTSSPDSGGGLQTLTVNNTLTWCTVVVTINGTPTTFTSASQTFMAAPGTTVSLKADPRPTFMPVKWTGVTTMNGDMATYVMSNAAAQSVTACCALANGTGC